MKYFIFGILIILIVFRWFSTRPIYKDGDTVRVSGRVMNEPARYERVQGIKMARLTIYLPLYPEVSYGDRLVVEGKVEAGKLQDAKLVTLARGGKLLFGFREKLTKFYEGALPEPHSALVAGVTLGSKAGISREFYEVLKKSGTLHVVVASGMNVTLVAGFLMSVLVLFLNRKTAVLASLAGIWIYVFLVGMEAPILRAAIMGSIAFSAQSFGRMYSAWRGLVLSALVMLLVSPVWIGDVGFILSFTATASLMLFAAEINRLISFVPSLFREGFATSLAASIGVTPVIYFTFGTVNFLSPLINALVLWTIPLVTIIGVIGGMAGLLVPDLGRMILILSYPLTSYFIFVINV